MDKKNLMSDSAANYTEENVEIDDETFIQFRATFGRLKVYKNGRIKEIKPKDDGLVPEPYPPDRAEIPTTSSEKLKVLEEMYNGLKITGMANEDQSKAGTSDGEGPRAGMYSDGYVFHGSEKAVTSDKKKK